ncbi:hypothetical protein NDA11_003418 [Ustilago hordei]|uniref:Uncharacterized protein n=1 Tax=Ustilago hordei TaxID=120017 RepID=I2FZP6_USTHO|nr:uncharacterized protein UHO2_03082 [Ustilago hordei]KAJ1045233.1 hypothetical protein NDA10_001767 [Ustilago hordei]KAJ1576980.1 hypothetical protein NDA15_004525 [Ustilago hordei]KAJ1578500.1 hypothetical protein NDA12_000659 [Ustilago hordei]KAJ1584057.1 hypothetical protein NDA11_003418 [Ustilago hordei]KAJ1599307.1 hypothetical protein NDA14_006467 [Ustilago hordei]
MAARTIQACIVNHTFASQYNCPDNIAELLCPTFPEEEVVEVVETLSMNPIQRGDIQSQQQENQVQYKKGTASTQGTAQPALTQHCSSMVHDLWERMFQVLFTSTSQQQEDTTVCSRHHKRTAEDYNAMLAWGWLARQCGQLTTSFPP